jgi:hypothetical protein
MRSSQFRFLPTWFGNVAMSSPHLMTLSTLALVASVCMPNPAEAQTPPDVLAAQVRAQGYHCEPPLSAKRDANQSRPDQAVWILTCRTSTFRIKLDPDMASQVEEVN